MPIRIRPAVKSDVEAIMDLHSRSIRALCVNDYSPEQIEAWAGNKSVSLYYNRVGRDPTFVAEENGKIVGYVRFYIPNCEFASLFVDPGYSRKGIGARLFARAQCEAKRLNLEYFWLYSSMTAVSFYERMGFVHVENSTHTFNGVTLPTVKMRMELGKN